ncbi:MAG: hypothetical protein RLZZ574_2106 [Cyanobacteriota bacterium]
MLVAKTNKEITMDQYHSIIHSSKYKHLDSKQIEYIIQAVIAHDASTNRAKRNTGKTALIRNLALDVGCCVATIYNILKDAKTSVLTYELTYCVEYSVSAACGKRTARQANCKNHSKVDKAHAFIQFIEDKVLEHKMSSIDETIHYYQLHEPQAIEGMDTICTKTFYTYVHKGLSRIKPVDLPRMVALKSKSYKQYIPKRQKGVSIVERPFEMDDTSEFGHWEGDLVVGPRDGQHGALFTLFERNTSFYYSIPIKDKKSKTVYMEVNKLHKLYGNLFSEVFKSITFDNGSEFSRYKDMEKKPNTKLRRTNTYFGRPFKSSDRARNENCNGLVRYYIKKGTAINTIPKQKIKQMNKEINDKKRKKNGYLPSELLYKMEIEKLTTQTINFYDNY